ncbi:hypothetical protein IKJ53_00080, partial [bacterium]|nr:hypothetical protein [bacterium]
DFIEYVDNESLNNFVNKFYFNNGYVGVLDKIAECEEIPKKTRDEFISKTLQRLEKENGYKKELTIKNSKIKNDFYTSKNSYNINYSNDIVTITNNKGGSDPIILNLQKLLEDVPLDMQPKIKSEIQKLPAEVLIDLAIECDKINKPTQHSRFNLGRYNPSTDKISIGINKIENITKHTIAHELGHAIDNRKIFLLEENNDYNNNDTTTIKTMGSYVNEKFKNLYDISKYDVMGLKDYLKIDSNTYQYSLDIEKLENDNLMKNRDWTEKYYKNEKTIKEFYYMFNGYAECYAELYCAAMLGELEENHNSYIPPELMNEFLNDLEKVRNYNQEQRHTREE